MEPLLLLIFACLASILLLSLEKMGTDLFRNLKQQSLEFITPSNSNTFFMPRTKSTFSCISDTNCYV